MGESSEPTQSRPGPVDRMRSRLDATRERVTRTLLPGANDAYPLPGATPPTVPFEVAPTFHDDEAEQSQ